MKNQKMRIGKAFIFILSITLVLSVMPFGAFASSNQHSDTNLNMSIEEIQIASDIMIQNLNANHRLTSGVVSRNNNLLANTSTRGTWRITDSIFNGTGTLASGSLIDMYVIQTTTDTAPAMKIVSSNTNLIVRLYTLNTATGQATGTNIYDTASDSVAKVLGTMPAGNYALGVYSLNNSNATGNYDLMWNCANPGGATTVAYYNDNLTKVILGYSGSTAVYCNGTNWFAGLKWEEHYTFIVSDGHFGRDQTVSDINVRRVNIGSYNTNKYSTNNALFVEVGVNTLWSIVQTEYHNNNGSVTHIMDSHDATGKETPRRLDSNDIASGPHYIVIDMNTNQVVDFASPYNFLWQSGQTTGSPTFSRTNILNQN